MSTSSATHVPLAVLGPPNDVPSILPPVETRAQLLPFDALSWENFERLCHRLTSLDGSIEHCARYGRQGEAQEGIDIFARQGDGRYHCLQAKRHSTFGAAKLRRAVDLFLEGTWAERAQRFTIAVQAPLRSTAVQEEIERQAARLSEHGITFVALDVEGLTERLRGEPVLIDDFFGRPWVAALLGHEAAAKLGARLDGRAFACVRTQLARVYEAQFQSVDPGSFGSVGDEDGRPALTLLERFLKPDILVRETGRSVERADVAGAQEGPEGSGVSPPPHSSGSESTRPAGAVANSRMRRLSLNEWLTDGERLVVLGDAGSGKSTLLRVIAIDLLKEQANFPEITERWGQRIPIYVPFARWASHVARNGHPVGLKEIVRHSVEHLLTVASVVDLLDQAIDEQRVLLLVDGLDEWSSEQAARTALSALVTTVEAHGIPVIVSGRPLGLFRIGALPATWKRGSIAPLSTAQQAIIAGRWFQRYAGVTPSGTGPSAVSLRTGRFMAELARDANLGTLAAVPLLLIGLVTLALRGQILPRSKGDIYDQLVRVLLEVHPANRATASGDTEPRFRHATDPDQRRAAIARLAYAIREQAGGAGMPLATARNILRTYLASSEGFDLVDANAAAVTTEILAVNAETQGLIVEKAPGEVGFVHASFEEYLGAEHIGGWPFLEIEAFVRTYAGDGRWRNVLANLLGRIQRRDEFERLVEIIEGTDCDELAQFHRQALLGDIAFSAAARAPVTARRLAHATMQRVESEDWLPARREALASVLQGLVDPTLKADIEKRLRRWLPARLSYRASLIRALAKWQPTVELQNMLWQAMHDEDRDVQRAAAGVYAQAFSPAAEACQRLLDGLARTRDLQVAGALLESLALGWRSVPDAGPLFEEAWESHNGELSLVGILGLAERGEATDEARDAVLRGQSFWSNVSYHDRKLAVSMLMKHWPDDDALVRGALASVSGKVDSVWEDDVATAYLLQLPVHRLEVREWILTELSKEFPFSVGVADQRIWSDVGRFAAADPEIRKAANAYWCEPRSRVASLHRIPAYVSQVADREVAEQLIGVLGEKTRMDRYWALKALLSGWGRAHPDVKGAIDSLAKADDADLKDIASLLPTIMTDKAAARARLIRMSADPELRRDLLSMGLQACGCDASDNQAVAAILAFPDQLGGRFAPVSTLFRVFGAHADVRGFARTQLNKGDGPLEAIAAAYVNDKEFAPALFDAAVPLPVDLRTQVIEVAANGAAGTALEAVLGQAMLETDPELRARMMIANLRALPPEGHKDAQDELLAKSVAVGIDSESVRATALAGLATIGALDRLAALKERGKPVSLETGNFIERIPTVERLICERFSEFEAAFGDALPVRFRSLGSNRLAEVLSTAPSASSAARAAFLRMADRGEIPLTPRALRTLAAERPRSELLLARCWDALNSPNRGSDRAMVNADVGVLLRDHFAGDTAVRQRLVEQLRSSPCTANAIPLAIFAPDTEELPWPVEFSALDHELGDWAAAVTVAACRADSTSFCRLLEAMVTRRWRSRFDAQQITNQAVQERLQGDSDLEGLMVARIAKGVDPSISGSFARYLAAAGRLGPDARAGALDLLQMFGSNQRLPVAAYDAITHQWRAMRATLLDAVSAGLELG